jgi:hypothetical protein
MAKRIIFVALLLALIVISFAGCRGYGYRHYFGGGPHLDYMPELTFPLYLSHKPVPYEELRDVYPSEKTVSGF